MKKKLLILFLGLSMGAFLFTGCKKEDTSLSDLSDEPSQEEQELLDLCNSYIECNDFVSANTLVENTYGENSFFVSSKKRLEKKEKAMADYVTIMQEAKDILDQMIYPEGSLTLYDELYALQNTEEFQAFLEYLDAGGSMLYIPHTSVSSSLTEYETSLQNGIGIYTSKNCDCIYWYSGSFYGTTRNSGMLVHADEKDAVVITGLNYELVRVVQETESDIDYTDTDLENPEIEDTLDQPPVEDEIEFIMEERIADGNIIEYFFQDGSYERKVAGPIKDGYFDGEVTFTEFVNDIAYTGTGVAHNGVFERLNDAIPEEIFETTDDQFICAALYNPYGDLYSLKLSTTQGLAEMHHYTVCPEKYQVYQTQRSGQITAFPFIHYKSLYRLNIHFSTFSGEDTYFTLNGPVSIAETSSDDFSSLILSNENRTRFLSAKVLGCVVDEQALEEKSGKLDIIPEEDKLINQTKETIISWLDDNTTYSEDDYYSVSESVPLIKESTFYPTKDGSESFTTKHATLGKVITRVTMKDSTGIVYEGFIVFMENYATGMRYQFSYMVERSLFEEERDLEITQSITLLNR